MTAWDPASHEETGVSSWDASAHETPSWRPPAHERAAADGGGDRGAAAGDARDERRVVRPRRWPARLAIAAAAFLGLVGVGLLAGVLFGDGGAAARTGPLTEGEVRDAAEAFGDAYAAEDPGALRQTLARDVVRVLPGGSSRGREQVVDQYTRQFDGKVEGYDLEDVEATGGRAGRASGTYRVDREGGDPYEGRIVFGVVRERGKPRIALIAATPKS